MDEREIEAGRCPLGRFRARQHARQAAHAASHGLDVAAAEPRRGGCTGRDARSRLEFRGKRLRLDAVAFELTRPDPHPDPGGRRAQLQGEHHAPENGGADARGVVHGPQGGGRRLLQQPMHEDLGATVPQAGAGGRPKNANNGNGSERRSSISSKSSSERRSRASRRWASRSSWMPTSVRVRSVVFARHRRRRAVRSHRAFVVERFSCGAFCSRCSLRADIPSSVSGSNRQR